MDKPQIVFERVTKALKAKPWFKKEMWQASTHLFPAAKPEAVTFHLFKKHWFNGDKQGIHIESFLALDDAKRKKSNLTIHILHTDFVPGTKIKRRAVSQPAVDAIYDTVSAWAGYKFRAGKYGVQPFALDLDGTSPGFEELLVYEVSRLSRTIGPVIDKALADALG